MCMILSFHICPRWDIRINSFNLVSKVRDLVYWETHILLDTLCLPLWIVDFLKTKVVKILSFIYFIITQVVQLLV